MEAQLRYLEGMVKTGKYVRGRWYVEVKAEIERLRTGIDHLRTQRHLLPGTGIEMTTTTTTSTSRQRRLKAASIEGSSLK